MDTITPVLDQESFRGRDDDVGLNVDTWNGGGGLNGDWSQAVDVSFRIRIEVQETAGGDAKNIQYSLQKNKNSGGWVTITLTSADVIIVNTTEYINNDTTTQVIGDGSFAVSTGVEAPGIVTANTTTLSQSTEFEFCLQIVGADVDDLDTIEIRAQALGSDLDSYTEFPTITVDEGGGPTPQAVGGALSFVGTATRASGLFFRTVTGALTFSGSILKAMSKATAGALSFVGAVASAVTFHRTVTGALSFAGSILKAIKKPLAGALSFIGTLTKTITFKRTVTGVLTFSGNAAKKLFEAVAGALSFVGTATRVVTFARTVAGALTFSGAASTLATFRRAVSGVLTFIGDLVAVKLGAIPQAVGGALTFVGDVATLVTFRRVVAGALTFIGIATRASGTFARTVTGALTSSGAVLKKTLKLTAGAISFTGIATRMVTFARTFAGAITFSGAASTLTTFRRVVSGALTFVGTVTKKVLKGIAGALTFIGAVVPVLSGSVTQAVGGALSFIGDVSKKTLKPLAGVLTFAGAITKVLTRFRTVVGALTFSGIAAKVSTFKRTVTGALTFAGAATRKTLKALGGVLTFTGLATRASAVFHRTLTGSLSFIGTIGTKALEAIVGTLTFIGSVVANFIQGGIADLTGALIPSTGWVLSPAANVTWRDIASEALLGGRYIELRTELNRTDGGLNGTGQAVTSNRIKMDVVPGQQLYFRCGLRWNKLPGANNDPASELRVTLSDGVLASTLIKVGDTLTNADGWNLVTTVLVLQGAASEFDLTFTVTPKDALSTPYLEAWGIDVVELYREPT